MLSGGWGWLLGQHRYLGQPIISTHLVKVVLNVQDFPGAAEPGNTAARQGPRESLPGGSAWEAQAARSGGQGSGQTEWAGVLG